MRRRDLLTGASALFGVSAFAGCSKRQTAVPAAYTPIHGTVARFVNPETLPGAVWLVARGGDVVVEATGTREIGGNTPMQRDTIFRIASMTKAVTSAAVLMLAEDGKLRLDETVDRLLPELRDRRVLRTPQSALDDTVPAESPIKISQLLDFTFGFGMSMDSALPIVKAGEERQLTLAMPIPMTPHTPDDWIARFSELPLMHQPGARWMYNVGSLIQGVLVKRASGQDLDAFIADRITGPLGMNDTGFFVPPGKLDRFAGCAVFTDPSTGKAMRMDQDGDRSAYASRPVFPSGAGGLCSTVDDYLAFTRLLKNGGLHGDRRLLSAESVRLMTTNQLSEAQITASADADIPGFFGPGYGWGYGLGVQIAPDDVTQSPGTFGWDGGFGSSFFVDPNRDLTAIVMTQSADFLFNGAREAFRKAVYQATA